MTNGARPIDGAAAWAAWAEGELKTLSNGLTVRVRPVDVLDMLTTDGDVYNAIQEMQQGGGDVTADNFDAMVEQMPILRPFLDRLVCAAIAEPVVVEGNPNTEKGQIAAAWIPLADKLAIFSDKVGGVQTLAGRFPGEPAGRVPPAPSSESVRAAARQLGDASDD